MVLFLSYSIHICIHTIYMYTNDTHTHTHSCKQKRVNVGNSGGVVKLILLTHKFGRPFAGTRLECVCSMSDIHVSSVIREIRFG